MRPKGINNPEANSYYMDKNPYSKMDDFVHIASDSNAMKIFLLIAKKGVRQIQQIAKDTSMELKDVLNSIDMLEKGGFISRNPGPLSQKFRLGFNGQLFAEQLKVAYPEVKEYLGEKNLIEPIRV